ncbi:hypothetical protein KCU61_g5316, partial [Aureobasidium melanogenum]
MSAYAPPGSMAWSAPQYPATSTQSTLAPKLKFFIERNDGSLVPLVPVDELPDDVRLIGVPLSLSAFQANDMLFLGRDSSVGRKFSHAGAMSIKETVAPSLAAMKYTPQPKVAPHNHHVDQHVHTQPLPLPASAFVPTHKPLGLSKSKPLYNEHPLPPSGIEPDPSKKIYCTYWIQNGQCGFTQQGCMYKHEIPEDKETLESIGLKSVPAWWRKEQARRKSKAKRTERNGSISEWEVVERHQTGNSAVRSDDPVRVRVPPSRPTGTPTTTKQVVQQCRSASTVQKDAASSDIASDTATAGSSAPGSSPPGGVKLGAAKTPVRGPPSLPLRKQTLESPIEAEDEENLIDFDVLLPLSSSDISILSQVRPEALANPQSKVDVASRRSKVITKGIASISPGRGIRSSTKAYNQRGSAGNKTLSSLSQRNTTKGKVETGREKVDHGNGVSRRGRAKTNVVAEVAAKATGETDTQ